MLYAILYVGICSPTTKIDWF